MMPPAARAFLIDDGRLTIGDWLVEQDEASMGLHFPEAEIPGQMTFELRFWHKAPAEFNKKYNLTRRRRVPAARGLRRGKSVKRVVKTPIAGMGVWISDKGVRELIFLERA